MVLLVTTDFSANSKTAIRFALQIAKITPCKIVLYHLLDIPITIIWSKYEDTLKKYANDLKKIAQTLANKEEIKDVSFEYIVETGDDVNRSVTAYAQKIKADYICISTHGAGTFTKIIGTNTSNLVNTSLIPIIAVPQLYRTKPIKKIGYASDLENIDNELIRVKELAQLLKATLDVYHLNHKWNQAQDKERISRIANKHQSDSTRFVMATLNEEHTLVENIQRLAKKEKASLLIMFSQNKDNWFQRFFLESRTADMTYSIQIPLIALPK